MAKIVFSGGHSLTVSGSSEQWKAHLTTDADLGTVETTWTTVDGGA